MTVRNARLLVITGAGIMDDLTPRVDMAQAVNAAQVEVAFNTPMQQVAGTATTNALNPAMYSIAGLTITGVVSRSPTRVRLSVSEMVLGQAYTVAVASTLLSATGKLIATPLQAAFVGVAVLPTVVDANPLLSNAGDNLRVMFSAVMQNNAALNNPQNYAIAASGGATPVSITTVAPGPTSGAPTYVDLTITPMLNGGAYALTVNATALRDVGGNTLDPTQGARAFVGFRESLHPTVSTAVPTAYNRVVVTFSASMQASSALLTPQNYVMSGGLQVLGVMLGTTANQVVLQTSGQVGNKQYRLTINTSLVNAAGVSLDTNNNATLFVGLPTPPALTVSNLVARTHPDGNRIDLAWDNPAASFTTIKIIRRTRGVPFDAQDGVVLFSGLGTFSTYSDTQALQDNTFYYYAVLLSADGSAFVLDANVSTVECLSIRQIGSAQWIRDNALPAWVQERATTLAPGFDLLDPVVRTLGAAVDLLRGELEAYRNSSDQDASASSLLSAYNQTLNFAPEASFDMAALRRIPLHLLSIYKAKTTGPALEELVQVLTQWTCGIVEFGDAQEGTILRTYDGQANIDRGFDTLANLQVSRGSLTDASKTWTPNQWQGGILEDSMGHRLRITGNTAHQVTFTQLDTAPTCYLTMPVSTGATLVSVSNTAGLQPRAYVEITDGTNTQVAQVLSVVAAQSITLQEPLRYAFAAMTPLYHGTDLPDAEVIGTCTATGSVITDTSKLWVATQWKNRKLLDHNNVAYPITDNTANTVTVTGTPAAGAYSIAKDFVLGANFAARQPKLSYRLYAGAHNQLFEALDDLTLIGTAYDPFKRIYAGLTSLGSGFTQDDLAIFVDRGVAKAVGQVGTATLNSITDSNGVLVPHALAGLYLCPNRKQTQLFQILDNDAHTITVNRSLGGLASPGDFYFVLNQRDALRYNRLNAVIPQFIPRFTRAFVAFSS